MPQPLEYDDLPPGSDIRREYSDGCLKIVVPAGEPPPAVLRGAWHRALVSGAISSWAILLLAFVIVAYFVRINRVGGLMLLWAASFFAIFCTAVVLMVARVHYGMLGDALHVGRRQATVMAASSHRLLIETTGPFGALSHDWPATSIHRIEVCNGVLRDDRGQTRRIPHLAIQLFDTTRVTLLPGRDYRELQWISSALQHTLGRGSN